VKNHWMIAIRLASGYVSFSICNSIANAQISSHTTALGNAYECGVFLFLFLSFLTNMTVVSTCSYYALSKMCKSMKLQILGICKLGFNMLFLHLVYLIIDGLILHLLMSIHHIPYRPRLFSNQACFKKIYLSTMVLCQLEKS
jgi:hypothetical protein